MIRLFRVIRKKVTSNQRILYDTKQLKTCSTL